MSYSYAEMRPQVFTPSGQEILSKLRKQLPERCTIGDAVKHLTGDSWTMLACIEYLEEVKEIQIHRDPNRWTQCWIIEKITGDPLDRARDSAFKGME